MRARNAVRELMLPPGAQVVRIVRREVTAAVRALRLAVIARQVMSRRGARERRARMMRAKPADMAITRPGPMPTAAPSVRTGRQPKIPEAPPPAIVTPLVPLLPVQALLLATVMHAQYSVRRQLQQQQIWEPVLGLMNPVNRLTVIVKVISMDICRPGVPAAMPDTILVRVRCRLALIAQLWAINGTAAAAARKP